MSEDLRRRLGERYAEATYELVEGLAYPEDAQAPREVPVASVSIRARQPEGAS